jgi:prophage regulatory protein
MAQIIRMPQLVEKTGVSRAHVYALMKDGAFPRPIRLGRRAVGWRAADVDSWLESRPQAGSWREVAP